MTFEELKKLALYSTNFKKEFTTALLNADRMNDLVTQHTLNEIIATLYRRLTTNNITIEVIGKKVTKEQFKEWVENNFNNYNTKIFEDEIGA